MFFFRISLFILRKKEHHFVVYSYIKIYQLKEDMKHDQKQLFMERNFQKQ